MIKTNNDDRYGAIPIDELLPDMNKEQLIKEHKHLVKVLKTGKGMKKEAGKQKKELDKLEKAARKSGY